MFDLMNANASDFAAQIINPFIVKISNETSWKMRVLWLEIQFLYRWEKKNQRFRYILYQFGFRPNGYTTTIGPKCFGFSLT